MSHSEPPAPPAVPPDTPPVLRGVWLRIALVVSLGVNLLAAGIALGFVLGGAKPARSDFPRSVPPERALPAAGGLTPRQLLSALPPERRAALVAGVRDRIAGQPTLGAETRAARMAVLEALLAEPFDPARTEAALTRWRAKQAEVLALSHRLMVEIAATMTAAERRTAFASARRGDGAKAGEDARRLREFRRARQADNPPEARTTPAPE